MPSLHNNPFHTRDSTIKQRGRWNWILCDINIMFWGMLNGDVMGWVRKVIKLWFLRIVKKGGLNKLSFGFVHIHYNINNTEMFPINKIHHFIHHPVFNMSLVTFIFSLFFSHYPIIVSEWFISSEKLNMNNSTFKNYPPNFDLSLHSSF